VIVKRLSAIAAILLLLGCGSAGSGAATQQHQPVFMALLANGTVVEVVGSHTVLRASVGSPWRLTAVAHVLSQSPDGTRVVTLVARGSQNALITLDPASLNVLRRYSLPEGRFRSVSVGSVTGRVYVGGNDTAGRPEVVVVSLPTGRVHAARLRTAGGGDWFVYQLIADERQRAIVASFHGTNTTGATAYSDTTFAPLRCTARGHRTGVACIGPAHGDVVPIAAGVLATMGTPPKLVESRLDGHVIRTLTTGLVGDHLMEMALADGAAYAIGSCGYTGGLSRIELRLGTHRILAAPRSGGTPGTICGERIAAAAGELAIGRNPFPVPRIRSSSELLLVNSADGAIRRRVSLASDVLDVIAVSAARR
jgi:hypothetical protein